MFLSLALMFIAGLSTGIFLTGLSLLVGSPFFKEMVPFMEGRRSVFGRVPRGEILGGEDEKSLEKNVGKFWEEEVKEGVVMGGWRESDVDEDDSV